MPGLFNLTGDDTFTTNNRVIRNFADGNLSTITMPNDLAAMKTGKNGNTVMTKNETGRNADVSLRLMRGSSDDAFFQALLNTQLSDFAAFTLLTGQFVKRVGDGIGNVQNDTYALSGGLFLRIPPTAENVDGDTEQAVAVYAIRFANIVRTLQ